MSWVSGKYVSYLESEVEFWRNQATLEREKAERATDALLQAYGTAPITETVRNEVSEMRDLAQMEYDKMRREQEEIFGETLDALEGGGGLPQVDVSS